MKYTCQIRKYLSMAAAAALLACMLSGCMRANLSSSSQNVSNDSAGQSTVSGGLSQEALAGAGNTSDQGQQSASDAQAQSAAVVEGQTAQNVSGTTTPNAVEDTAQSDAQTTAPEQQADESQLQQQEVYVESGVQAGSAVEAFTGEFEKSDGGETVVITLMNDNEISFQFSTSGIGSTAQAGGNTAVYYGEDGYSIVFDVAGDTLGVTVNGEGGSQTVMNGIYYRVLEGGNDSDDEGVDDPVIIDEQYDEQ